MKKKRRGRKGKSGVETAGKQGTAISGCIIYYASMDVYDVYDVVNLFSSIKILNG